MELKQFTDEQLTKAFANSNFGKQSKRDTILKTLSSIAKGYCSGSFSMAIVAELGLTEKRDTYYTYLTDLGLEVLLTNQSRIREYEN